MSPSWLRQLKCNLTSPHRRSNYTTTRQLDASKLNEKGKRGPWDAHHNKQHCWLLFRISTLLTFSAHAPVLSPHLCEFQLPGRPRRKNKLDQKAEHEELLKAMSKGYCWKCQQSCPHLSRRPNALEVPVAWEALRKEQRNQKIRNTEI